MSLPAPSEVLRTHTKLTYAEFDIYAKTHSFSLGPLREGLTAESTTRGYQIVFGTLRTGQRVYAEYLPGSKGYAQINNPSTQSPE